MANEKPMQKKHNRGGARPGAGRPAFVPTNDERKKVETLSGYGLPMDQIAILIRDGISIDTLRAHFETELKSGKAKANGQIAQTLFQKAMSGSEAAMIWWTKSQMRWSERHEITGVDGGPIKTENATTVTLDPGEAYKRLIGGGS
jgi:hypothetical protein